MTLTVVATLLILAVPDPAWSPEVLAARVELELGREGTSLPALGERLALRPLGEAGGWRVIVRHRSGYLRLRDLERLPSDLDAAAGAVVTVVAGMLAYDPAPEPTPVDPSRSPPASSPSSGPGAGPRRGPPAEGGAESTSLPPAVDAEGAAALAAGPLTEAEAGVGDPPLYERWWFWVLTGAATVLAGGVVAAAVAANMPPPPVGTVGIAGDGRWVPGGVRSVDPVPVSH